MTRRQKNSQRLIRTHARAWFHHGRGTAASSVTPHPPAGRAGSREADPAVSHSTGGAADRPSLSNPTTP